MYEKEDEILNVDLWTERYRPKSLDDYVWRDLTMRAKFAEMLESGVLPNLLFSGSPGTGKTSLALLLLNLLDIPAGDILFIPASRERKIEDVQDRLDGFVTTWALGPSGVKYVVFDEFDAVSPLAQKMLRTAIEMHSDLTRFIATCNYENKILPALHSRFQTYHFKTLAEDDFIVRVGQILADEGIDFDVDVLQDYIRVTYPDLRKAINLVQQNSVGGRLTPPKEGDEASKDYLLNVIDLFRQGKFIEGRKLILSQAQVEEYPEIYRFLYRNLNLFGATQRAQDEALLTIRKAVVNHTLACDPEILLAATLAELTMQVQPDV